MLGRVVADRILYKKICATLPTITHDSSCISGYPSVSLCSLVSINTDIFSFSENKDNYRSNFLLPGVNKYSFLIDFLLENFLIDTGTINTYKSQPNDDFV
jgi:hypothetical protein